MLMVGPGKFGIIGEMKIKIWVGNRLNFGNIFREITKLAKQWIVRSEVVEKYWVKRIEKIVEQKKYWGGISHFQKTHSKKKLRSQVALSLKAKLVLPSLSLDIILSVENFLSSVFVLCLLIQTLQTCARARSHCTAIHFHSNFRLICIEKEIKIKFGDGDKVLITHSNIWIDFGAFFTSFMLKSVNEVRTNFFYKFSVCRKRGKVCDKKIYEKAKKRVDN